MYTIHGDGVMKGDTQYREGQFQIRAQERMIIILVTLLLLTFSHSEICKESDSIAIIESQTRRDVSYIRLKEDGSCSVKFVDSSR